MAFENWTFEEWQNMILEKYQELYKLTNELIPDLWNSLEFALSIKTILNIKNCTLPFAGILLGPPSSLKSRIVGLFMDSKNSYYTDKFSPKAFVSHYAGIKEEELKKIDMIPKIKDKLFLTSDLSPMFTKKDEEINEIIGIITRLLDGEGLMIDSGACGQRGYKGEYNFMWLGAAVDIPFRVHKLMSNLGPKLYFLRLPKTNKDEDSLLAEMDRDDFIPKLNQIRKCLLEYLELFDRCPSNGDGDSELVTRVDKLIKIQWDNERDEKYVKRMITRIGILLGHLRANVTTWKNDFEESGYGHATASIEAPTRAIQQLKNLARGHALSQGRNWITIQDLPLLIKVALSTAALDRVNIFDLLINNKGTLTTSIIKDSLSTNHHVAHRIMEELNAVELVDFEKSDNPTEEKIIHLKDKPELKWFLTAEFKELREGFKPTDYSEYIDKFVKKFDINLDEKDPPCNTTLEENLPPCNTEQQEEPIYNCYECARINHGTPVYQTNSESDYTKHWVQSGHKGPCKPGLADIERHGWVVQGKEWEK